MKNEICDFLKQIDIDFPIPISEKTDIDVYSEKLSKKAELCLKKEGKCIIGMVAGYTENLVDNMAYICLVGVLKQYRGKGIAMELVKQFIDICRTKNIQAIHLYTHQSNLSAIKMYQKIGFEKYVIENESRYDDIHLIFKL